MKEQSTSNDVRATFIVNDELLDKVKAIAHWEKVDVKDVVNKAFSDIIIKYEEEHKNKTSRETERILKLFKNERRDKKEKE